MRSAKDDKWASRYGDYVEYSLSASNRRIALYVGLLFLFGAFWSTQAWRFASHLDGPPWGFSIFAASCLLYPIALLLYRVRIGEFGVARRYWLWWHFWPREAFKRGDVRRGRRDYEFVWRGIGWPWRRLHFRELDGDASRAATRQCLAWMPRQPTPTFLELKLASAFRTGKLVIDKTGLTLHERRRTLVVPWEQVARVRVVRERLANDTFRELVFSVPNRELRLSRLPRVGTYQWRGARPDELWGLINEHLPSAAFEEASLEGPLSALADAEERLGLIEWRLLDLRWAAAFNALMAGLLAVVILQPTAAQLGASTPEYGWGDVWRVALATLCFVLPMGWLWAAERVRRRRDALRRERDQLLQ